MIIVTVTEELERKAREQIAKFEKTPGGKWRYGGVEAWKGVVCEFAVDAWLSELERKGKVKIKEHAKGIDTTGKTDPYDILTDKGAIEVYGATKHNYRYAMPKKGQMDIKSGDTLLIIARFNEEATPNNVEIHGFMKIEKVKAYIVERDKGTYYYKVPIKDFEPIENLFSGDSTKSSS